MNNDGWDWENYWSTDYENGDCPPLKELELAPVGCRHEWKATYLIFSHVYDCQNCGAKKEEL